MTPNQMSNIITWLQVFVLMQFDPGMEYRPDWGSTKLPPLGKGGSGGTLNPMQPGIQRGTTAVKGLTPTAAANQGLKGSIPPPGTGPKDDKSWLLLCSALTDGPYSYI